MTDSVRSAVLKGDNVLSVASYWEVVLKSMKGKLDVGEPRDWWAKTLDQLQATPLAISADHVAVICSLPPIHQDPFDRLLIAQARSSGLTLLTTDTEVARYCDQRLAVIV